MLKKIFWIGLITVLISSCGYNNKVQIPYDIKTIYIPTVKNQIPIEEMAIYTPGMEVDMTNAVISRFIEDGTLKVVSRPENADATMNIYLRDYWQEGTRFTNLESVEEYRLFVKAFVQLKDNRSGKNLVHEEDFRGKTSYFRQFSKDATRTGNTREPISEVLPQATQRAIEDFAHNVVDLVTEAW